MSCSWSLPALQLQSHILGSKSVISPSSIRPQLLPSLAAPLLPSTPLAPLDLHQVLWIFPSKNGHSSFFALWPLSSSRWVSSQSPQFVQSPTRAIPGSRTGLGCPATGHIHRFPSPALWNSLAAGTVAILGSGGTKPQLLLSQR